MAKRDFFLRYMFIIQKLRNSNAATFDEIKFHVENEFEILGEQKSLSLRTFQREKNELLSIFNIEIKCNDDNQYYINEDNNSELSHRMLEAFDVVNLLSSGQRLANYILPDNRCKTGTEHIYRLLHAIRNSLIVNFKYHKFYKEEPSIYKAEPYAVKEFDGRWYLVCRVCNEVKIKTFGLDRIKSLDISQKKFRKPQDSKPKAYFADCFGIIRPDEDSDEPEEIILEFDDEQKNYIKTYPLHESQQPITDDDDGLRIKLKLHVTFDFKMKLLSYGDSMKVIKPKALADEIRLDHQKAFKQYDR